ncbi:MAG: DUF4148 domain-containing protein [Comamonadaceae bacterium]|nr:MAG: DUF4148 domain-containing protein [Comamonadaceae bacterium]
MNKNYRNLAALSVLAVSAFAAQAQSPFEGNRSNSPSIQSAPSTLTRAQVIADLQAARANGTMLRDGDSSEAPRSINEVRSTLNRADVRAEAIAAAKADTIVHGEH